MNKEVRNILSEYVNEIGIVDIINDYYFTEDKIINISNNLSNELNENEWCYLVFKILNIDSINEKHLKYITYNLINFFNKYNMNLTFDYNENITNEINIKALNTLFGIHDIKLLTKILFDIFINHPNMFDMFPRYYKEEIRDLKNVLIQSEYNFKKCIRLWIRDINTDNMMIRYDDRLCCNKFKSEIDEKYIK